jgi:DNA-binding GntR family transcriptional regulator
MQSTEMEKTIEIPLELREKVYTQIKEAILNRELQSGMKLTIDLLSKMFNVSPTPIKEALVALEREGLIENKPRRGAFVTTLTLRDVEEIYSLKEVLEGLTGKRAVDKVSELHISKLNNILKESEKCLRTNDFLKYEDLDTQFHSTIREIADDKRLEYFISILNSQIKLVIPVSSILQGRMESSLQEHRKILSSLERKNSQSAEFYCREHIKLEKETALSELKFRGVKIK